MKKEEKFERKWNKCFWNNKSTEHCICKLGKEEVKFTHSRGYIHLVHRPGEAQAGFNAADFYESGVRKSGKYFTLSFPYSNGGYIQLKYGENMECLLEAMRAIFEYIGCVPQEIWFDNTKTIVTQIIKGGGRDITERFMGFAEHYGFKAVFVDPASGLEKGSVENKVSYGGRNMLVPVPCFLLLDEVNCQLLRDCDSDANREHYLHTEQTIFERFDLERHSMLPLPSVPFETAGYVTVRSNKWGKFTLNRGLHEYSVSPEYAETTVRVKLTGSRVIVMNLENAVIVRHRRLYGGEGEKLQSMDWLPYLKYLARKPCSLRSRVIYDMMPEPMRLYLDTCPESEYGKILSILSELTARTGFYSAVQTVKEALICQATNADSLKNLYLRLYSDIPELP